MKEWKRIVVYKAGGLEFGLIHRDVLRCIPYKEEARVLGFTHDYVAESAVLNSEGLKYIKEFDEQHSIGFEYDYDAVGSEMMLRYIDGLSEPTEYPLYNPVTHPYKYDERLEFTFWQLVAYNIQMARNKKDGNTVRVCSVIGTQGTIGLDIRYRGGGGIFIGIEPDGYAHS